MISFKYLIVSETAFQPRADNYFQFFPFEQKSFVPDHFVIPFSFDSFQFLFHTLFLRQTAATDLFGGPYFSNGRPVNFIPCAIVSLVDLFSQLLHRRIQSLEYGMDKRAEQEGLREFEKADYNSSNEKSVPAMAENLCRRCERFREEEDREKYPSENIFYRDFH